MIYFYELCEGKMYMLLKMSGKIFEKVYKKYNILPSNFPKRNENWFKLIIDEKIKGKKELLEIITNTIDEKIEK